MMFERQTPRRLHEEHETTLRLLSRFEQALLRARTAPSPADAGWGTLEREVNSALAMEVERHFAFEEQSLFPRLDAAGEAGISMILRGEHDMIREVAAELMDLLRASRQQALPAQDWAALKAVGLEIVERMVAHIQKEEMALLPAIEAWIDESDDEALMLAYAAS